jgi:uncharacterized oxidoreductase
LNLDGNTVLITGGATGIGFALAQTFVAAGSEVIVCGRRKSRLQNAKRKLPAIHIRQCDVSVESERQNLLHWTITRFPHLNMLINNAGIQRSLDLTSPAADRPIPKRDDEVSINLFAPIRLCALFIPKLMKRQKSAIVNISSGLAFVPIVTMPIYCATKAAIHSFTISLRHQLKDTPIRVFEAAPPTTDTELDSSFSGEREAYRGISPKEVAAEIAAGIRVNKEEIIVGEAQRLYRAARRDPEAIFKQLND